MNRQARLKAASILPVWRGANLRAAQYTMYQRIMKSTYHRSESMKRKLSSCVTGSNESAKGRRKRKTIQHGRMTRSTLLRQKSPSPLCL